MKKLFSLMALLMWCVTVMAQTHTVGKGETLQSIADKYHVSVSSLIAANPGSDNLFFVGLVLNIPKSDMTEGNNLANSDTNIVDASTVDSTDVNPSKNQTVPNSRVDTDEEDKAGAEFAFMIEYGFLSKPEMASSTSTPFTYAFTVGANYFFMHHRRGIFGGARIGYNSATYVGIGKNKSESHFITIPICVGYTLRTVNRKWAISPQAGFDFNFCVGGKDVINDKKYKIKKKVGVDARIGVQLDLHGFGLGCSYVFPVDKNNKKYFGEDAYVAVNIGFTV